MDIPFEKVSVAEAQAALAEQASAGTDSAPANWSAARQTNQPEEIRVTKDVMAWLAQLPPEIRPRELAIQYPRIFNKIAELWARPMLCEKYLDELLLDERGTRIGFPAAVAGELTALKTHFIATSTVQHFGVWGERIGR